MTWTPEERAYVDAVARLADAVAAHSGHAHFTSTLLAVSKARAALDATQAPDGAIIFRSQRKAAMLETALANLVYEVTHLSPCNDDGTHDCKISAEALRIAREALRYEQ